MSFNNIIGQKRAINHIKNMIKSARIPPGLLFCANEGTGRMTTALELAKILNCRDEKFADKLDSCGKCLSCRNIADNIHPDVIRADFNLQAQILDLPLEKQQHIRIETIRELLRRAQQKPMLGNWKVFIVDKAQTMLMGAANALLKLLEEPPPQMLWILITTKKSAMLPTILSRCQTIDFSPLKEKEVAEILIKNKITSDVAFALAKFSRGSVEKALRVKEIIASYADVDSEGVNYPFDVSANLPKELASARKETMLILELLITCTYQKWKAQENKRMRSNLHDLLEKFLKFETYLTKNVSPHRIIEASLLNAQTFNIKPFSSLANLV